MDNNLFTKLTKINNIFQDTRIHLYNYVSDKYNTITNIIKNTYDKFLQYFNNIYHKYPYFIIGIGACATLIFTGLLINKLLINKSK